MLPRGDPGTTPPGLHSNPPIEAGGGGTCDVIGRQINQSWAFVDKKPAGQRSKDQPNLKETTTTCGSLVALNRLPEATLGHHLTLPEKDPEREDNRQTLNSAEMNYTSLFFIMFIFLLHRF